VQHGGNKVAEHGEERVPRFMVESYPVGLSAEELTAASDRAAEVTDKLRLKGIDVRLIESTLVPAEESLFCIFEAPSKEVVEEVASRAALPIERVVDAVDVGPGMGHQEE
jgi:hypothetical protein